MWNRSRFLKDLNFILLFPSANCFVWQSINPSRWCHHLWDCCCVIALLLLWLLSDVFFVLVFALVFQQSIFIAKMPSPCPKKDNILESTNGSQFILVSFFQPTYCFSYGVANRGPVGNWNDLFLGFTWKLPREKIFLLHYIDNYDLHVNTQKFF